MILWQSEIMDTLDANALEVKDKKKGLFGQFSVFGGKEAGEIDTAALHAEAAMCRDILALMSSSVLLLDEVCTLKLNSPGLVKQVLQLTHGPSIYWKGLRLCEIVSLVNTCE